MIETSLIQWIANTGFPIATAAYLLIDLKQEMQAVRLELQKLNERLKERLKER